MYLPASIAVLAVSFSATVHAVTLFEGLAAADATHFAQYIQADPSLVDIFTNPNVQTVFAPNDDAFAGLNKTAFRRSIHLAVRQNINEAGNQECSDDLFDLEKLGPPGGSVVDTNRPTNGGGKSPIVSKSTNAAPGNGTTKRQSAEQTISLFSGLGNNVTIVKGDTKYDGGLIQTVNGFFTTPLSLTTSIKSLGLITLATALDAANLTTTVAAPLREGVTVFAPSEAAFAKAGGAANVNIANHIVTNFTGLTPRLKDGLVLTTQAGTKLTVHVRGGDIYIGNAKISANDVIVANGAIQVLDSVIQAPVQYTGAAARWMTLSLAATAFSILVSFWACFFLI